MTEYGGSIPAELRESGGPARRGFRWVPRRAPRRVPLGSRYRVLLVCSSGGHAAQLVRLRPWWERHERTWVSFDTPDVASLLAGEHVIHAFHPTTRNIPNLLRNLSLSIKVLRRERPDVIVSDGAGLAVPFFWVGRLLGCRTVYLEVYDRVSSPTMTGRLCQPVTDLFLVQWREQLGHYRGAQLAGPVY
ncbi:MAG: UDP-N-acetylglucosamine--LPS N-acetylglucosamine transferase [Acidimicrobiales bacterium]